MFTWQANKQGKIYRTHARHCTSQIYRCTNHVHLKQKIPFAAVAILTQQLICCTYSQRGGAAAHPQTQAVYDQIRRRMYRPSLVSAVARPGAPGRRRTVTGALVPRVGDEHVRLSQPPAELAAGRALAISHSENCVCPGLI